MAMQSPWWEMSSRSSSPAMKIDPEESTSIAFPSSWPVAGPSNHEIRDGEAGHGAEGGTTVTGPAAAWGDGTHVPALTSVPDPDAVNETVPAGGPAVYTQVNDARPPPGSGKDGVQHQCDRSLAVSTSNAT